MKDSTFFPIADAHCDYLYHAVYSGYALDKLKPRQHITLDRLSGGRVAIQFFAVWLDSRLRIDPLQQALSMTARFYDELRAHSSELCLYDPSSYSENSGKVAAVLTMEGLGEAMNGRIENLDIFARLGVRASTLIWNDENDLASPAASTKPKIRARGLKELGKQAIRRMNELGMAVDLSHLNDRGIDDVLEISTSAPFASHSNARGAYDALRSLNDEHIKEIARRGGVIGVNFYYGQLTDKRKATLDDVVRQIDYIAELAGTDAVAIGSDFDGMDQTPKGIEHPGEFQNLPQALIARGYSDDDVMKILYSNLKRYIDGFYN